MNQTEERKMEHLKVCLNENVEFGDPLFNDLVLVHNALPGIDFDEIDTGTAFLGKRLKMPLMIAAITGGCKEAKEINKSLAGVAEKKGIGFGTGSQKAMVEEPSLFETYYVRGVAPNCLVLGNLGIDALKKYPIEKLKAALDQCKVDGVCVHLNVAQEFFQKDEEMHKASKASETIKKFCGGIGYPVIAKEVGNGISREVALKLKELGVKAIDVGGFGGTSWIVVDGIRSGKDVSLFKSWGIPTACSIVETKSAGLPIIATGGIRTGLDIAKSIALGASICGIALPFLKILDKEGKEGVEGYIDKLHQELKTAMYFTGSKNISELKKARYILHGKLKEWAEQRIR